jgi:hypothetical protein
MPAYVVWIASIDQSREASVLFLDLLTGGEESTLTYPASASVDERVLRASQAQIGDTHDRGFDHENGPMSDDGDDASRASSDFSW